MPRLLLSLFITAWAFNAQALGNCGLIANTNLFSYETFAEYKQALAENSETHFELQDQSPLMAIWDSSAEPELLMALWETSAEREGILLNDWSSQDVNDVGSLLSKNKDLSQKTDLHSVSEMLYILRATKKDSWFRVTSQKHRIRQRIEIELIKSNLFEAMENLGFLDTPGRKQNFQTIRRENRDLETAAITVALNSLTVYLIGTPVYLPQLKLVHTKRIPDELIELVREVGFEKAWPDLKQHLGIRAKIDIAAESFRKVLITSLIGLTGYLMVQLYPVLEMGVEYYLLTPEKLAEHQELNFIREQVIGQQVKSWALSVEMLDGVPPTEDELTEKRNQLRTLSDEQLKVDYGQ